jgi:cathepsin B
MHLLTRPLASPAQALAPTLNTAPTHGDAIPAVPVKVHSNIPDSDVPDNFNSYDRWPGFCHPIRDQARCGSCWAFAASEVLSDRFAIASNGTINKILSPEDMVSCDTTDSGCNGGYLDHAWEYLVDHGIVTETCFPYGSQKGKAPACIHACVDGKEPFVKYKAFDFYQLKTELDIQKEIMTNGPVEAGFTVYTSFMAYKSGVYHKRLLDIPEGGHAIKIVGWGIEAPLHKWQKPQKYWLCANSWTDKWGDRGFFKIR